VRQRRGEKKGLNLEEQVKGVPGKAMYESNQIESKRKTPMGFERNIE